MHFDLSNQSRVNLLIVLSIHKFKIRYSITQYRISYIVDLSEEVADRVTTGSENQCDYPFEKRWTLPTIPQRWSYAWGARYVEWIDTRLRGAT